MGTAIVTVSCALVTFLVIVIIGMRRKPRLREPRLEGTWQSDADATISEWRRIRPLSENQEKLLKKTFGKMRITFEGHSFSRELGGALASGTFRVVKRGKKVIVIKARTSGFSSQKFKIRFQDDNTYWTFLDQTETWECFRRIK